MAKNKTNATDASVAAFIDKIDDEQKRDDAYQIIRIMQEASGFDPVMWGPSIIGFGTHHYKYASGHEGDMPVAGFSPRKSALVLYVHMGEKREELLRKFGKHKPSKGCVYFKRLADVDLDVLKKMVALSIKEVKKSYPSG
ncbi:MAG TPA: DUF1801 domain-containing protein [Cyclobacteriaceae bacterium]|nr:DUF1801 domain-containing protein [Cyclobacteriaceae bacterium]